MIRFWAPHQVADDWYAAIRAIRSEYVVRMAPPDLDAVSSAAGHTAWGSQDPQPAASYTEPVPVWTAAMILLAQATSVWENTDPETEPTERLILERDRCHCTVPGCSRRQSLEVHHMIFRSQGGSNARSNRTTVCHGHHRQVHEEHLRITGEAPHALTYEFGLGLGPMEPGSSRRGPVWVFYGEKLVRGPGYAGARAQGRPKGAPLNSPARSDAQDEGWGS